MNNTQLYLSIGIPTITVILAWLSNRSDFSSLKAEIARLEGKVDKQGDSLRAGMNGLRKEIYEFLVPLHERMAVIETKQK